MKIVGRVTVEERDEIKTLFERRNGLNELAMVLNPSDEELYERLVKDMGETTSKFQDWWDKAKQKYQWESHPDGQWQIEFDTCDIYLITPQI